MSDLELKLPQNILKKAFKSGNEYGWRKVDVLDVIESARNLGLATVGGQIQYLLPQATCELYWLSYDSDDRKPGETWEDYCDRSAFECSEKFKRVSVLDSEADLKQSFGLDDILYANVNMSEYQVFILYFADR